MSCGVDFGTTANLEIHQDLGCDEDDVDQDDVDDEVHDGYDRDPHYPD